MKNIIQWNLIFNLYDGWSCILCQKFNVISLPVHIARITRAQNNNRSPQKPFFQIIPTIFQQEWTIYRQQQQQTQCSKNLNFNMKTQNHHSNFEHETWKFFDDVTIFFFLIVVQLYRLQKRQSLNFIAKKRIDKHIYTKLVPSIFIHLILFARSFGRFHTYRRSKTILPCALHWLLRARCTLLCSALFFSFFCSF